MSNRDVATSALPQRRVAVVGAGLGGLAAALRLQAAGVETTLFEARDAPGGRAYVYREGGFVFDAGPTVITAPSCLEELFAASGTSLASCVDLIPTRPFYRILWSDGEHFDYRGDRQGLLAEVKRIAPDDLEGYERFYRYSERVFEAGYSLVAQPFLRLRDMLRVAPQLLRVRADRSVYATVSRFVRNERLRQVLSFHSLLIGGHPFETSSIYTLIHFLEQNEGVFFVRGGTGALVKAIADRFVALGGVLRLSTPVRRIRVDTDGAHRVESAVGEERFDALVSNADVHHTYSWLYRDEPRARRRARRLERMKWSMSLFVLYFGTNRVYDGLAHHTVVLGPRYRGLLDDVFHGRSLPEDFSLYLHAPSVSDPSLAPEGCQCFYVLSPVPHLGNAPIDWDREAPAYADRILASLERVMPDLRKHVVVQRAFTPLDFTRELAAYHGSAFSVAPLLQQSAWFRPHNRDGRIPGLYLVGAGTHPGAGVPGVINSAKGTVATLLEDLGRG